MKKILSFRNLIFALAFIVLAGAIALWVHSVSAQAPHDAPVFPHASLTIEGADGQKRAFDVEIATTPEQEAYGLMFRRSLAPDAGMIFVSDPDRIVSMWMKNTFIPLDMLYVRRDGVIVKIVANAVPFDLTPLPSGEPVHGVIELKGGEAANQGIKTGDKVIFQGFSTPR